MMRDTLDNVSIKYKWLRETLWIFLKSFKKQWKRKASTWCRSKTCCNFTLCSFLHGLISLFSTTKGSIARDCHQNLPKINVQVIKKQRKNTRRSDRIKIASKTFGAFFYVKELSLYYFYFYHCKSHEYDVTSCLMARLFLYMFCKRLQNNEGV